MHIPSYVSGPIFLVLAFLICAVVVVGTKSVVLFIKESIQEKLSPQKSVQPAPKKPTLKKSKYEQVKSIAINTEDIDRIYFRKSS